MMLTSKELTAIEEQLSAEQVLVKKYTQYASETNDNALKNKYNEIANKHKAHFGKLMSYLN